MPILMNYYHLLDPIQIFSNAYHISDTSTRIFASDESFVKIKEDLLCARPLIQKAKSTNTSVAALSLSFAATG